MSIWQVEHSGSTMLVVRRKGRTQQDLARNNSGRIIWFTDEAEAQKVADDLNDKVAT